MMINLCEKTFAALLDPYVDGELTEAEMLRVREHLEICPVCRAYVDSALAIRAAFPGAEETEVPEGFADALMERIRTQAQDPDEPIAPEKKRRSAPWIRTALPLAACCAVVILLAQGPLSGVKSTRSMAGGAVTADTAAPAEDSMETAEDDSAKSEEDWDALTDSFSPSVGTSESQLYTAAAGPEDGAPAASPEAAPEGGAAEKNDLARGAAVSDPPQVLGGTDYDSNQPESPEAKVPDSAPESAAPTAPAAPPDTGGEERKNGAPAVTSLESEEDPGLQAAALDTGEEGWVEYGNVIFASVVCLEKEDVGSVLDGFEGRPYSDANDPEAGVIGTGYALEPEDFERILEELAIPLTPSFDPDHTTELRCIVVRESS